jgi:hypothetical protein
LTSQSASAPFSSAVFLYLKLPIDLAPIFPLTPASSKASRAADFEGISLLIGQPFGTIEGLQEYPLW